MKIEILLPSDGVKVGSVYVVLAKNALNYLIKNENGEFKYVPKKICKEEIC